MKKKQFVPNDNNNAVAYYRFSSHAQNEQSIDQQREMAEKYANEHGIKIIGDMPIYTAMDSSDVWQNPELFQ